MRHRAGLPRGRTPGRRRAQTVSRSEHPDASARDDCAESALSHRTVQESATRGIDGDFWRRGSARSAGRRSRRGPRRCSPAADRRAAGALPSRRMSPACQPARRHRGLDEHHVRTERGERVGHLDSHDSGAEHDQPVGHRCRCGDLPVGPRRERRESGDRWDRRRRSGCDHNGAPGLQHVIPDADAALAVQTTPVAPDEGDAAAVKPRELTGVVQIADDLIATGEDRSNVELARDRLRRALVGTRRASASACAGRSNALEGMQRSSSTHRQRALPR